MELVQDTLVVGVSMDGGHQPFFHAEGFVEHHDHGGNAVSGARGIGYNAMLLGVVVAFIDPQDDGHVLPLRRSGDDHLLGPALQVGGSLCCIGE